MRNWRAIFASTAIVGSIFLMWDELFTALEVWGFNERYLSGFYLGRLPIEEYGFFITVPFACLFIHEVLRYFVPRDILFPYRHALTWFFLILSGVLGIYFYPRIYSSSVFFLCALLLVLQLLIFRSNWLGRFYLTYIVCMIPFTVLNGWLTGAFTEEPIVWYNNFENANLRLGTIPIEDAFYQLAYLMLIVWIYERNKLQRHSENSIN